MASLRTVRSWGTLLQPPSRPPPVVFPQSYVACALCCRQVVGDFSGTLALSSVPRQASEYRL